MKKIILLIILLMNLVIAQSTQNNKNDTVKNIILFIGDGMGNAQVASASYIYMGRDGRLEIEKFPIVGLVKTHAIDKLITDSASGATALATGYKTNVGMVSVTPDSLKKETIFEAASKKQIKTGIVVTSHITDATPSCFVAHVPQRSMQDEIAEQMVHSKLSVILGGGKSKFIPKSQDGSEREDEKNLILSAIDNEFTFVDTKESLEKFDGEKLIGLFSSGGFQFNQEEPSLAEMTNKAIEILSKSGNGFLLMVEGSQIDWRGHDNNFDEMIEQVKLFDDAVKVGKNFAESNSETLVIVTADHETGGLTLSGDGRKSDLEVGTSWSTGGHTAIPVPIYSYGPNSNLFTGVLDNTDIPKIISKLFNLNMDFDTKEKSKVANLVISAPLRTK